MSTRNATWALGLLCTSVVLLHCSSSDQSTGPQDGGASDATSGDDSATEAGSDATPEASPDGAGADAAADSGSGTDSGDAATPCDVDAGKTVCSTGCVDLQTDGANCGACGHDCLGGACTAGACQPVVLTTVANGASTMARIATDGQYLAWTNGAAAAQGGGVYSVLATGANQAAVTVASQADTYDGAYAIAMHAGNVYWTQNTSVSNVASLDKGTAQQANSASALSTWGTAVMAYGLVANSAGTALYMVRYNVSTQIIDIGTCDSTSGLCNQMTSLSSPGSPFDLRADGTNVYWTQSDGKVQQMALGGSTPTTVTGQKLWYGLAINSTDIFWGGQNGAIGKMPIGSTTPANLVPAQTGGTVATLSLEADAKNVYFLLSGNDNVLYVPVGGGAVQSLATGKQPSALTRDDKALYWLNRGDGTVRKVALP